MPLPEGSHVIRILEKDRIRKRKRKAVEQSGQTGEALLEEAVGFEHVPEPGDHGISRFDAGQSSHRDAVDDGLDGGGIEDVGLLFAKEPVEGHAGLQVMEGVQTLVVERKVAYPRAHLPQALFGLGVSGGDETGYGVPFLKQPGNESAPEADQKTGPIIHDDNVHGGGL